MDARNPYCGAKHPTNASVVPCTLFGGHPGPHHSTTGCAGSAIEWRDAPVEPNDVYRVNGEWIEERTADGWRRAAKVAGAVRLARAVVDQVIEEALAGGA